MAAPRIALVTCKNRVEKDPDENLLVEALRGAGLNAEWIAWDDKGVDPGIFDLCVLRTTWNFYERPQAFEDWIELAEYSSVLFNSSATVHANLHKSYLNELEAQGIPVIPTRWSPAGTPLEIKTADEGGVVVKPCISASSYGTRRFAPNELDAARAFAHEMAAEHDMLVQPMMKGFAKPGERSLIWIDGEFTHAVTKRARYAGDPESTSAASPVNQLERSFGERVLATVTEPLLYARVDMILQGGQPVLSELELIEPSLYLREHPPALERFVRAIARRAGE